MGLFDPESVDEKWDMAFDKSPMGSFRRWASPEMIQARAVNSGAFNTANQPGFDPNRSPTKWEQGGPAPTGGSSPTATPTYTAEKIPLSGREQAQEAGRQEVMAKFQPKALDMRYAAPESIQPQFRKAVQAGSLYQGPTMSWEERKNMAFENFNKKTAPANAGAGNPVAVPGATPSPLDLTKKPEV